MYVLLIIVGVPRRVSDVTVDATVDANTTAVDGSNVILTLNWEKPFYNFNPIVNYTISCFSVRCPQQNFTTTDNSTTYTIANLSPNTHYTFSVVATNSFGSGEAGVVMITTPGNVMLHEYTYKYV